MRIKPIKAWAVVNREKYSVGIMELYSNQIFATRKKAHEWSEEWAGGAGLKYGRIVAILISH